jgi:ectoine hydroxylase-related dioxygenase (phytanoyl-CoA dioxygenase family)
VTRDRGPLRTEIDARGCALVESLFNKDLVRRCRTALERAIETEAGYHGTTDYADYCMVQCCPMYDRVFIDLLDVDDLIAPLKDVLGAGCIVYSYASSSLPPGGTNFAARIHVDCPRLIPGYLTNMGVVVLLDDFTEENGATFYLPGSHTRAEPPDRDEFFSHAERLVAPAGSAWFVNPRVWHAAGTNTTGRWRHSIGINMCRPYMKQRIDIPRLLADTNLEGVSNTALQKLGFHAQPPTSLDEYYAPPENRTFRQRYE